MIKRIILVFLILFLNFWFLINNHTFAEAPPPVNCIWLPWCKITAGDLGWNDILQKDNQSSKKVWLQWVSNVIAEWIKYVAVLAVISIIVSWFFYIFSWWDEAKTKKAKSMIIWSLLWVIISMSAWGIINLVNKIQIN